MQRRGHKKRSKNLVKNVMLCMHVRAQAQSKQHFVVQHTICAFQLPPLGLFDICQQMIEPVTDQFCGLSKRHAAQAPK